MAVHLQKELDKIKKRILALGALVEERVYLAAKAINSREIELCERIIRQDHDIDEMEVEIEEECLKILALHQPVAIDLRFIIAVIKINNDLERIGDQAVNIAQRVAFMATRRPYEFAFDYSTMAEKSQDMLRKSLDALINFDLDLAFKVLTLDDEVDRLKDEAYDRIKVEIRKNPDRVGYLINMLLVSRHLERLADHATNIAEEVVYLVEGEIVRHGNF
ncbi:MAG: phosphate signaling complex protein PhoU [Desulfobacterales bacterium]|nr:phosphate signaling complex protein PhoU [Desulfobacterales bacterium]